MSDPIEELRAFYFAEGSNLAPEVKEKIAGALGRATKLRIDHDAKCAEVDRLTTQWKAWELQRDLDAELGKRCNSLTTALETERAKSEALRQVAVDMLGWFHRPTDDQSDRLIPLIRSAEHALSTDAGTLFLQRLCEAEALLSRDDWHHNQKDWDEFQKRRQAFCQLTPPTNER